MNSFTSRFFHILVLSLSLCMSLSSCRIFYSSGSIEESLSYHLRNAERYTRKKEYENAIQSYKSHIDERLELKERPEWENPYFYWLLIGDLYLKLKDADKALESYEFAESKEVSPGLLSDRYRYVAHWYAKQKKFDQALTILSKYRDRDELLFDLTRDRIARDMVKAEEETL